LSRSRGHHRWNGALRTLTDACQNGSIAEEKSRFDLFLIVRNRQQQVDY
jgi:hypothetical protein